METAFRLAYALVLAILLILFVILGFRVVYPGPESPWQELQAGSPSQRDFQAFERDQAEHDRNVLVAASLLGAVIVGLALFAHRRAMPLGLGLALGAVGVVAYGWAEAGDHFDEMGATAPFLAVGLGLAAVALAGWFFLRGEPLRADGS